MIDYYIILYYIILCYIRNALYLPMGYGRSGHTTQALEHRLLEASDL